MFDALDLQLHWKRYQVFSCEFCKICINYDTENEEWTTAGVTVNDKYQVQQKTSICCHKNQHPSNKFTKGS